MNANANVQLAYIVCGVIGAAFLVLALILVGASLAAREKKAKVVKVQQDGSFFSAGEESAKLRSGARTNAREATQYANLADLPGEKAAEGVQEINRPLSHAELLGQLGDDEEDQS